MNSHPDTWQSAHPEGQLKAVDCSCRRHPRKQPSPAYVLVRQLLHVLWQVQADEVSTGGIRCKDVKPGHCQQPCRHNNSSSSKCQLQERESTACPLLLLVTCLSQAAAPPSTTPFWDAAQTVGWRHLRPGGWGGGAAAAQLVRTWLCCCLRSEQPVGEQLAQGGTAPAPAGRCRSPRLLKCSAPSAARCLTPARTLRQESRGHKDSSSSHGRVSKQTTRADCMQV